MVVTQEEAELFKWKGIIERHPEQFTGAVNDIPLIPEHLLPELAKSFDFIAAYINKEQRKNVMQKIAEDINKKVGVNSDIIIMDKFSPVPYAERIMSEYILAKDRDERFFIYNSDTGLWESDAENFLKTLIRKRFLWDEQQKTHYVKEIIEHLKDITRDTDFCLDNSPHLIAFRNKVYNLEDGKFYDFRPEYQLTNKLNIDIDPEIIECPNIDKFFADSVGEDYKSILYDILAYTLYKGYPYQKLFFIYGPASTGKSLFMNLAEKFLGEENYCAVEPRTIQKDIHATSQMLFKLANMVSDINYDEFENITQVKKLCGGDTVTIRQMYKNPFNSKIYAKQIYTTNKLPVVKEKTRAWYRRVYLVEFANIIKAKDRDTDLLYKITTDKELKGLTYQCLMALQRIHDNNFKFSFDMNEDVVAEVYEELSNPVLRFINTCCETGSDKYIFKYDFTERLSLWLKDNHLPPMSSTQVNNFLKEHYRDSKRPALDNEYKSYWCWVGMGWKDSATEEFTGLNSKDKLYIKNHLFTKQEIELAGYTKEELPLNN